MKKLIFNADDFGNSIALNQGIKRGSKTGIITSTSLMATGCAFDDAIFNVLPEMPPIKVGVHLNIIEGQSLTNPEHLCDKNGRFNKNFLAIRKLSQKPQVLKEIENEFRAQIEKVMLHIKPSHLDSHVHTHAITPIFDITCKLAHEYNIPRIRTQYEVPYRVPNLRKNLNIKYPINLIKRFILNNYTKSNKNLIKKYNINTNDYFVGVTYTGYMDEDSVEYGLKAISGNDGIVEVLIHPHYYKEGDKILSPNNYNEFLITQSQTIKNKISKANCEYL